ncbi:MAG: OB-fold nucleic acid binding domain-containing protein [Archaeoglobaceae archaeon]
MKISEHFAGLLDEETVELLEKYIRGELKVGRTVRGRVEKVYIRKNQKILVLDSKLKVVLHGEAAGIEVPEGANVEASGKLSDGVVDVLNPEAVKVSVDYTPIAKLIPDERFNVRGRVSGLGDVERGVEIYLSDESGRVRVLLWTQRDLYNLVDIGDCVEILNGIARLNRRGEIELHVDRRAKARLC